MTDTDRQVAEKLGWKYVRNYGSPAYMVSPGEAKDYHPACLLDEPEDGVKNYICPKVSTDIAAAMEAAEAYLLQISEHWNTKTSIAIERFPVPDGCVYEVTLKSEWDTHQRLFRGTGDTLPAAICSAITE